MILDGGAGSTVEFMSGTRPIPMNRHRHPGSYSRWRWFQCPDPFGEIEAVKTVSDLYAPVSGTVIAVNENIENEPESVNSDPYGKGWLIKIQCSSPEEKPDLLSFAAYGELVS
jgi:hypothetical protein